MDKVYDELIRNFGEYIVFDDDDVVEIWLFIFMVCDFDVNEDFIWQGDKFEYLVFVVLGMVVCYYLLGSGGW